MPQTQYADNVMPELCLSPKLEKTELASISYPDTEQRTGEQENGESEWQVLSIPYVLRYIWFHFNQKL